MKKYKIGICGFLDREIYGENGQTMRTITVQKELQNFYGEENVLSISSHIWRKRPFKFLFQIINMSRKCENIIIFPDRNGIKVILTLFCILNVFKKYNLYYNVIGAWLPEELSQNKRLLKRVKKIDKIFVETNTLKKQLEELNVTNTKIFRNFKQLTPLQEVNSESLNEPYKLCFFSRVTKLKGIENAINVVKRANLEGYPCSFDIYGPIDKNYKDEFEEIIKELPDYIKYKGSVDAFKSVETLKDYYIQLFPTLYKTEGIPGSIIDSFFAGTPVLASQWNSCFDLITDMYTGITYKFGDEEDFYEKLIYCFKNKELVNEMKKNCLKEALEYDPKKLIEVVTEEIDKKN